MNHTAAAAKVAAHHIPPANLATGAVVIGLAIAAVVVWKVIGKWIVFAVLALALLAATPAFEHAKPSSRTGTVAVVIGGLVLLSLISGMVSRRIRRRSQPAPAPRPYL